MKYDWWNIYLQGGYSTSFDLKGKQIKSLNFNQNTLDKIQNIWLCSDGRCLRGLKFKDKQDNTIYNLGIDRNSNKCKSLAQINLDSNSKIVGVRGKTKS